MDYRYVNCQTRPFWRERTNRQPLCEAIRRLTESNWKISDIHQLILQKTPQHVPDVQTLKRFVEQDGKQRMNHPKRLNAILVVLEEVSARPGASDVLSEYEDFSELTSRFRNFCADQLPDFVDRTRPSRRGKNDTIWQLYEMMSGDARALATGLGPVLKTLSIDQFCADNVSESQFTDESDGFRFIAFNRCRSRSSILKSHIFLGRPNHVVSVPSFIRTYIDEDGNKRSTRGITLSSEFGLFLFGNTDGGRFLECFCFPRTLLSVNRSTGVSIVHSNAGLMESGRCVIYKTPNVIDERQSNCRHYAEDDLESAVSDLTELGASIKIDETMISNLLRGLMTEEAISTI